MMASISNLTLYHASPLNDLQEFQSLSHFGTLEAALHRARSAKFSDTPMTVYQVELDVKKALRIPDLATSEQKNSVHSWMRLVDQLHYDMRPKILSSSARDAVHIAGEPKIIGNLTVFDDEKASQALIKILSEKGFDALVYQNEHEDPGSQSWMIFQPDQVHIRACLPAAQAHQFQADASNAQRFSPGPR